MKGAYEDYVKYKQWDKDSFGKVELGAYYDCEIERALGTPPARLRIVEFGFGNGEFLGWARSRGHEIVGVDIIEELNQRAREAGFDTAPSVDALLTANASSYDLVGAFDVLEHIEQVALAEFLKKVHGLLRPGGILLARFPNGDSPFGLKYQHGDLTHRTILGALAVAQLMGRGGFSSFTLCAPCRISAGLAGFAKRMIKLPLQFCIERTFRYLYYGKEMPSTLAMNYILIARK
ncbi:MAG: class I SAM-dependent methyltransferase [Pseudomonadota bacterium]|nr:class I SAM-dependent methyltransferase [Pseudomonadota bacterium]